MLQSQCFYSGLNAAYAMQVHPKSAVNPAGTRVFPPNLFAFAGAPPGTVDPANIRVVPLVNGTLQVHPQVLLILLRHIA